MSLSFKIVLFFAVTITLSCEKKVNTYLPSAPNLQVVSGIISADSVAQCYVYYLNTINTIKQTAITTASIIIYDANKNPVDTLKHINAGFYLGSKHLTAINTNYTLISIVSNMPNATCTFQFPKATPFSINSFVYNLLYVNLSDPSSSPQYPSLITIQDPAEENFYQFELYQIDSTLTPSNQYQYTYSLIGGNGTNNTLIEKDGGSFLGGTGNEKRFVYFVFRDTPFNNTNFAFDFYSGSALFGGSPNINITAPKLILIVLKTLSKPFYLYLKSLISQSQAQNASGVGINSIYNLQPYNSVYSNIENGVGIIATYNIHYKKIIVTP
jgi:hypothetical protein